MTICTLEEGILFKLEINTFRLYDDYDEFGREIFLHYVSPNNVKSVHSVQIRSLKKNIWGIAKNMTVEDILKEIQKVKNRIKKEILLEKMFIDETNELEAEYVKKNEGFCISDEVFNNKIEQWKKLNQVLEYDKEF